MVLLPAQQDHRPLRKPPRDRVPAGPRSPGREAPLPQAPHKRSSLARLGSLVLKRDLPEASM